MNYFLTLTVKDQTGKQFESEVGHSRADAQLSSGIFYLELEQKCKQAGLLSHGA